MQVRVQVTINILSADIRDDLRVLAKKPFLFDGEQELGGILSHICHYSLSTSLPLPYRKDTQNVLKPLTQPVFI